MKQLHHVSEALGFKVGCGDNSCIWGSPGGMATNGGCRCGKSDATTMRLELFRMAQVARHLLAQAESDRFFIVGLLKGADDVRESRDALKTAATAVVKERYAKIMHARETEAMCQLQKLVDGDK